MAQLEQIKAQVKELMVEHLMLQLSPEEIQDDTPLFGPEGLSLDSVDALQLVVALEKTFGLKIPDPAAAKEILKTVNSMTQSIQEHQQNPSTPS